MVENKLDPELDDWQHVFGKDRGTQDLKFLQRSSGENLQIKDKYTSAP